MCVMVLRIHSDMRHTDVEVGTLPVDHAAWLHTVRIRFYILGGACPSGFAIHVNTLSAITMPLLAWNGIYIYAGY